MLGQVDIGIKLLALGVGELGSQNGNIVLALDGEADLFGAASEVVAAPQEATCWV